MRRGAIVLIALLFAACSSQSDRPVVVTTTVTETITASASPVAARADVVRAHLQERDLRVSFEDSDEVMDRVGRELCGTATKYAGQKGAADILALRLQESNIAERTTLFDVPTINTPDAYTIAVLFLEEYCPAS